MIKINSKTDCCGCSACEQICPKACIQMKVDEEGFEYPSINTSFPCVLIVIYVKKFALV